MDKRIFGGIVLAASMALIVVGCQAPAPAAPAAATAAPTQVTTTKTLNVGILLGITGMAARLGMNFDRFIRLGIDDVNAKGGFKVGTDTYLLNAITVDDKYTSEGGRDGANRLVLAEKVRFIMGTAGPDTPGAQPVTEPAKVLLLGASLADISLGPSFPLTVQLGMPHVRMRAAAMYDWLQKEHPGVKRVALALPDSALGHSYEGVATELAQAHGMSIAATEYFPENSKDLGPIATRLLRSNPDAIDNLVATYTVFTPLAKALYDQGYRKPFFSPSADLLQMRDGGAAMEGFATAVLADVDSPTVSATDRGLIQRYLAKFPQADLEPIALNGYNIPMVLAQALAKAGTVEDTPKVAEVLRAGEWDTTYGKARFAGAKTFGLPSVLEQAIYLSKVQNGKVVTFQVLKTSMP